MTVKIITPQGEMVVAELVAERLLAAGHITRKEDGTLYAPNFKEAHKHVAELGICDFCSAPEAKHLIPAPNFDFDLPEHPETIRTHGKGWSACDECHKLVKEDNRQGLLLRAVNLLSFGKWTAAAIAGLHKQFWQARDDMANAAGIGAAIIDFINDTVPKMKVSISDRDKRIATMKKLIGVTDDELAAIERGDITYKNVTNKLAAWHKKYGGDKENARRLAEVMEQEQRRPMPPGHTPHWQVALDAKLSAITVVSKALDMAYYTPEAINAQDPAQVRMMIERAEAQKKVRNMDFTSDAKFLRVAETYSFNEETTAAIFEATKSIPHETPLSAVETPTGAGWFWFKRPLDIAPDYTGALLWGWTEIGKFGPAIRFSTYVVDEANKHGMNALGGKVLPATRWYWPLNMTFHEMIALNTQTYRDNYSDNKGWTGVMGVKLAGEKDTIAAVAEMSMFFLAACVWFKQKILISAPGPIERHARKRYVREHKLKETPTVRVIALRASVREEVPREKTDGEAGPAREYHYRWVVKGHNRLQACGPGRKDRKLIWVDPYPKGPEDKPFKQTQKVYAVIR